LSGVSQAFVILFQALSGICRAFVGHLSGFYRNQKATSFMDIENSSGNVFADLNCDQPAVLQLKAKLMIALRSWVIAQQQTGAEIAQQLDTSQDRVELLLADRFNAFNLEEVVEMAAGAGIDLDIRVP
jgi:predicted XRE-type DNA-binding protein